MANIRDVAKKAGVSVATVSRVVNKNGYVKKSTLEKVNKAISELNYSPNAIAVSLNNKKTKTLGLILPDITNPFFPELAKAVEEVANQNGYTMILCNSNGLLEKEMEHIEMLERKYADGIILASDSYTEERLKGTDLPMVLLDRGVNPNHSSITANNFSGAVMATKHLLKQGCKKIAHIAGPKNVLTAVDRLKGYQSVVRDSNWYDGDLIIHANYNTKEAITATKKLLEMDSSIDGIFASNDLIAIGCLKAIRSIGWKVPDDIAVIGFDGISLTDLIIPQLSTIKQPVYEMGEAATKLLINEIEVGKKESLFKEFDVTLIHRESTDKRGEINE
ncbi:transcriptional regulator [Virgibacillus indicus]|uniref:Transcriptional regulator n=1 Tax=Virgibacillus indicus TaxID=2024554 RepID=A0A265N9Q5_9BACI|nr:LacI family DNA-binding transcriptional regulator [Virgibacillus indicus]OZU88204.1 transcriptional regulator [Virgibacillus indicus]